MDLSITNDTVLSKSHDERVDFNVLKYNVVNSPFLDGDVPCSFCYDVYILQHIRLARVYSNVSDINNRNRFLTAKLQGYQYHKHYKAFLNQK